MPNAIYIVSVQTHRALCGPLRTDVVLNAPPGAEERVIREMCAAASAIAARQMNLGSEVLAEGGTATHQGVPG